MTSFVFVSIFEVKLFAQNAEQMHIVNHLKRCPTEEKGNVLEESARRAHGDTRDLADLHVSGPDAVSMPGELAGSCAANCSF